MAIMLRNKFNESKNALLRPLRSETNGKMKTPCFKAPTKKKNEKAKNGQKTLVRVKILIKTGAFDI